MADQKLTSKTSLSAFDDSDVIHVVDVSDTTSSPQGTSKKGAWSLFKSTLKTYNDTLYNPIINKYIVNKLSDLDSLISGATPGVWLINANITLDGNKTIPAGVELEFVTPYFIDLVTYSITGANTKISANTSKIFTTTGSFVGSWDIDCVFPQWFGASTTSSDNQDAFQASVDFLDTGDNVNTGGKIVVTMGTWNFLTPVLVRTTDVESLSSITIEGRGEQNTVLKATAAMSSVLDVRDGTYCEFVDFSVDGNSLATDGIRVKGEASGETVYSHIRMKDVFVQNCNSVGFRFERGFLIKLNGCRAKGNVNGFSFEGYHTSSVITGCYALNNSVSGFKIDDMSYSTFTSCAADTNLIAYNITKIKGVSFVDCGAESNARSMFYFTASAADDGETNSINNGIDCRVLGGFSYNNDTSLGGYGGTINSTQSDTSSIYVEVSNFTEISTAGTASVVSSGATNHDIIINNSNFANNISAGAVTSDKIRIKRKSAISVTAANTPIASLSHLLGTTNQYSGLIHIIASNSDSSGSTTNTAGYVLLVTKSTGGSGVNLISSNGLTAGAGASHPSFTFTLDTTNNDLEASPVASTTGSFYFIITSIGAINSI